MDKKILITLLSAIFILGAIVLIRDFNKSNAKNSTTKSVSLNKTQNNNAVQETQKNTVTSNDITKKYAKYKLNQIGKTGDYQLKTISYSEKNEIKALNKTFTTTNRYVIVDIEIAANDRALEFGYSPHDFMLVDSQGKTYNAADITNELNVDNEEKDKSYVGIFKDLNPDVFKKTQLVFEVSKDIKPSLLINKNEGSTTYVEYELQ